MARQLLPNGCSFSTPCVHPANWRSSKASVRSAWYISYRYHDPAHVKHFPKGKLVAVRGMNEYKTTAERRAATELILEELVKTLQVQGFNPVTNTCAPFFDNQTDITPDSLLPDALKVARNKIAEEASVVKSTLDDLDSSLTYIQEAVEVARLQCTPVGVITRKYVVRILESCGRIKDTWTAHTFNKYRTYLMMLFKIIVKYEAVEANPVLEIDKAKTVKRKKKILDPEQRREVADFLCGQERFSSYGRYMQIFFHSGARSTELHTVKVKDVDLVKQQYRVIIKKGRRYVEEDKTIKDIALPLWKELLSDRKKDDPPIDPEFYIFSKGFRPGKKFVRADRVNRRWKRHVKSKKEGKLNLDVDFYAFKYANTTEVANLLTVEDAARLNSHQGTAMVVNIYDVNREQREHERLKKVDNEF